MHSRAPVRALAIRGRAARAPPRPDAGAPPRTSDPSARPSPLIQSPRHIHRLPHRRFHQPNIAASLHNTRIDESDMQGFRATAGPPNASRNAPCGERAPDGHQTSQHARIEDQYPQVSAHLRQRTRLTTYPLVAATGNTRKNSHAATHTASTP
ncbi:hypothetical protein BT67DRAFT_144330 [Trichocladium antarcticum]|uniref:Uncharacterized protein n=1 Tax=Trichocladium antarcticum TaxID=1450529 RepID=A0AAN6UEU8_9PEZI|nr:hypothetical protein BT67DRAFT_144330 [Trichocladium antarcticum]